MSEKTDLKKLEEEITSLKKNIEKLQKNESELLKENNELKQIKKYFDVLMQNTEDYIVICDSSRVPRAFNLSYKTVVESLLDIEMEPGVQPFEMSDKAIARGYWESLQNRALNGEKFVADFADEIGGGYFETIFCPVKDGNRVTGFTEITRNITDRKKIEKELEESNSFRSNLLENAPIAILVSDPDNAIMYVNSLFEKLTGYTKDEVAGVKIPYPWWVENTDYSSLEEIEKNILNGGIRTERRYRKKNGEYSWADVNAMPIYHNGKLSYILSMWIDISERKKAEQENKILQEKLHRSQTMESLGLLAGGVAHDLNNVLTGIVSYPELLLTKLPADSELKKPLKTIKEAGDRATAIVHDLLTIARGVATEKCNIEINNLIYDYLISPEFVKLQQYHPGVIIKTCLDDSLLNVKGSYIHLRKTLMNLVSNASEAIEDKGNVTITTKNCFIERPLKKIPEINPGEYVVLSVTDDGIGISTEDLKRIFEPFFTKKVMGRSGTGLGLAVVWNVMREHNGYINVESNKNGTTFELYLPASREVLLTRDFKITIENLKGNGQKILIVDDVESQRDICGQILVNLGYEVHSVASGEDAVEYLKHNAVDLILLDMLMDPGINGLETYERIIKIHPHQKTVLISGYAATDEVKRAQELGAGALIKKPVTIQHLGIAVKEELEKN